ncbi:hydrolase [Streptomyces umbrinus]|uniref:alpha/beta hydrolase n=1 Tax=Streptomyces umbrinus TaxID=67370 RepID=UPI0019A370B2|nr:alpha/beta hydrolase [Streptomyces umbrinus]GHB60399.1 hydrolase [Streptomyces umbrinus]
MEDGPFGPEVRPPNNAVDQMLLYVHGDPRLGGRPHDALPMARELARLTGYSVVCARYRPVFPAALDDVGAAYAYCRDRGPVAVAGKRLGGALAAGLLLRLRDEDATLPTCAVLMTPLLDLTLDTPSLLLNAAADRTTDVGTLHLRAASYAGPMPRSDPLLSPLHGNLHGLPPVQLHAAGTDVLLDDTLGFAARAARSGVTVDLRVHEDVSAQGLVQPAAAADFLRRHATARSAPQPFDGSR